MALLASGGAQYQWGVESTKGTAVNATTKLSWPEVVVAEANGNRVFPNQSDGTLTARREGSLLTARGTGLTVQAHPLALEELYAVFGSSVQAGVSPTQIATSGTYLSSYTASAKTVGTFDTGTFERILSNGTNELVLEANYCACQSFTIESSPPGAVTIQANFIARKANPNSSKTASQTLQSTLTRVPAARGAVYVADSYSDLVGATGTYAQISNQIVSVRHTYNSGLVPNWTLDGRSDLDFSFVRMDPAQRSHTTELRVLLDHQTSGFAYDTGITDSIGSTIKWFQVLWELDEAAGGENYLLSVIGCGLVEQPAFGATNQNGMESVSFSLVSIADESQSQFANYSFNTTQTAVP